MDGCSRTGAAADGASLVFNVEFTDLGETHVLQLENAVLHHRAGSPAPQANATLRITHALFIRLLTRTAGVREILQSDDVALEGSELDFLRFLRLLDPPDAVFPIVTP